MDGNFQVYAVKTHYMVPKHFQLDRVPSYIGHDLGKGGGVVEELCYQVQ